MKPYELVVLLHPDLEIDTDKPLKKIEAIIKQLEGKITLQDVWGKRKLAYKLANQEFAVYVYYELELPAPAVRKLEKALNITDEVMRYLLTYPVPKSEKSKDINEQESDKEAGSEEDI